MDVRNCRNCGRMFNYLGGPTICPICRDSVEKEYEKVRDYIRDNPHSNIQKISDDCEVTVQQINQWVREERLEFSKDSPVMLTCENCGATVRTGRYCEKCKNSMANNLNEAFRKPVAPSFETKKQHESDKMRFKR